MYNAIKMLCQRGRITPLQVYEYVTKGFITTEQANEIVGNYN